MYVTLNSFHSLIWEETEGLLLGLPSPGPVESPGELREVEGGLARQVMVTDKNEDF